MNDCCVVVGLGYETTLYRNAVWSFYLERCNGVSGILKV